MWTRALKRLAPYPGRYCGFDLDTHRREIEAWLHRARQGEVAGIRLADLPKWRFDRP
jgi:hypothetical protein